jgi:hypothetical protein
MRRVWPGRFVRCIGGRERVRQRAADQGPAEIRKWEKERIERDVALGRQAVAFPCRFTVGWG